MPLQMDDYLSNEGYFADNQARLEFGHRLMLAFKQKNISEGINVWQSIHMHSRFRAWDVQIPAPYGAGIETVDLLNMILSGDIETACVSARYGVLDDMTNPRHWINQERLDWCVEQMERWLGWRP